MTLAGTDIKNITILHANTEYPTPIDDVNLKAMVTIGNTFNTKYGYSDHTLGIEVCLAAVASLSASVKPPVLSSLILIMLYRWAAVSSSPVC